MNTKRILIADNDTVSREIVATVLRDAGYEVALAADGEQAVSLLASSQPALILADFALPELDGKAALSCLQHVLPNIPVILFTAHTEIGAEREAKRVGAADYINKPMNLDALLHRVAHALIP